MKYKVEYVINTMYHKSAKLVQVIQKNINAHKLYLEKNVFEYFQVLQPLVEKSEIYNDDNDFKICFCGINTSLNHLINTIDKMINSRIIPVIRNTFQEKVSEYGKTIEDNDLELCTNVTLSSFFEEIKEKLVDFENQLNYTTKQTTDRIQKFTNEVELYKKLNTIDALKNKFHEEIVILEHFLILLRKTIDTTTSLKEKLKISLSDFHTEQKEFFNQLVLDVKKQNVSFFDKIIGKTIEKNIQESNELKNDDVAPKKRAVINIENMPMPDFTTPRGKKSLEIIIDFSHNNHEIMSIVLEWIKGKYTKENLTLQIAGIQNKKAILALAGPKNTDLESFRKDLIHDIISTITMVTKREKIMLKTKPQLNENFLSKIIPKISYSTGNLYFVSYEKEVGNLLVEYVNIQSEIEKLNKDEIEKIVNECLEGI